MSRIPRAKRRQRRRLVLLLGAVVAVYGGVILRQHLRERAHREALEPFQSWEMVFLEDGGGNWMRLKREGIRVEGVDHEQMEVEGYIHSPVFTVDASAIRLDAGEEFLVEMVRLNFGGEAGESFIGQLRWRMEKETERASSAEPFALTPLQYSVGLSGERSATDGGETTFHAEGKELVFRPRRLRRKPGRVPLPKTGPQLPVHDRIEVSP